MPPFSRYYKRFSDKLDDTTLKDYWGIQINPTESLEINHSPYIRNDNSNSHSIEFHIDYSKTYSLDFMGLPREISDIINEYARDTIEIRTWTHYPEAYPFNYPSWEYVLVKHNTIFPLEQIISQIIDRIHCNYQKHWSPIIRIESQFLSFFVEFYRLKQRLTINDSPVIDNFPSESSIYIGAEKDDPPITS
jgi:hypothetical protein